MTMALRSALNTVAKRVALATATQVRALFALEIWGLNGTGLFYIPIVACCIGEDWRVGSGAQLQSTFFSIHPVTGPFVVH